MPKAKLIRKTFPKIRVVSVKGAKFYQVDARRKGTSGSREHFTVKAEAEKRAQEIEDAFGKLGREGLSFPTELRVMALNCAGQLGKFGKTLNDATQHYIGYLYEHEIIAQSLPVNVLVDKWLGEKRSNVRKPLASDTLKELQKMGNRMKAVFGETKIRVIKTEDIETYLDNLKIGNQTRKNIVVKWGQFFNWAIPRFITINPCEAVEIYPTGREIERYEADFVQTMFQRCEANYPDLLPYLAICTFAGVRPSECERLTWENISLETSPAQIEVKKTTIAVKDFTRHATIQPNLLEWLKTCPRQSSPIVTPNHRKRFDALKIELGFRLLGKNPEGRRFIPDGLRHTFASFWQAKHKNVHHLAAEMGNSVDMIRNHYNKAVRAGEVEKFWNIVPKALAEERARQAEAVAQEMARKAAENRQWDEAFASEAGETEDKNVFASWGGDAT